MNNKKNKTNLKSEIRKNYLLNKYVIITPTRALRPRDTKIETIVKRSKDCYFCPDIIDKQEKESNNTYIIDKIKKDKKWQTISIKNIFPAVTLDNDLAYGTQEVIIETPQHNKDLAHLDESDIESVLKMYAKRTKALSKNKKIEYILCFKNQGPRAGASIAHAHSQVFATSILPPDIQDELCKANSYKTEHKKCVYCDIIKKELNSERKIFEDDFIAAFTPYASEYHYESWIFTKRHLDNITVLSDSEFKSFAKALKIILNKVQKLNLPFNFFLHNAVSDTDQHFYLKIQPRGSVWAGVELGSGLVINSVPPEMAAKYYRGEIEI